MKIWISLSEEDNLVTLKNIAPNFDFQQFAGNPIMHPSVFRRLNEQTESDLQQIHFYRDTDEDENPSGYPIRLKIRRLNSYFDQPTAQLRPTFTTTIDHTNE